MPFDGRVREVRHTTDSLLLERAMLRIADRKNWCRFAVTRRRWFSHEEKHCMLGAVIAESGEPPIRVIRTLALTIDPEATDYGHTIIQFNDGSFGRWSRHSDVIRVMKTAVERLKTVNTRWSQFS